MSKWYDYTYVDLSDSEVWHCEFKSIWNWENLVSSYIAEDAAEIFHDNDGYDDHLWPIKIEIFRKRDHFDKADPDSEHVSLGKFTVEREAVPNFYSEKIEEKG